jgi:hypothetical protein
MTITRSLLLLLALSAFGSKVAFAEFSNFAKVKCDLQRSMLTIAEDETEEPEKYTPEPGFQTKAMDDLVRIEDVSDIDSYRHKVADWKTTCQLGSAAYAIEISPWNWNDHIGGMCGAGSPEIELTVIRNGRRLLNELVFWGYCDNTWNEKLAVLSVTFSESARTATFTVNVVPGGEGPKSLLFAYKKLPHLKRIGLHNALVANAAPSTESAQ